MVEKLKKSLKLFFFNRVGLCFVAFNVILLILGASEKGELFRFFHFTYEPWSIKMFFIINLPAILLADWVEQILYPVEPQGSLIRISDLGLFLIGLFTLAQWLVTGFFFKMKAPTENQ